MNLLVHAVPQFKKTTKPPPHNTIFIPFLVHAVPHQSRPVGARQLPPGGSQGDQAFSSKCMDRDLKRVSITCLAVARMSTWAT